MRGQDADGAMVHFEWRRCLSRVSIEEMMEGPRLLPSFDKLRMRGCAEGRGGVRRDEGGASKDEALDELRLRSSW
jgi:hypothetical protein